MVVGSSGDTTEKMKLWVIIAANGKIKNLIHFYALHTSECTKAKIHSKSFEKLKSLFSHSEKLLEIISMYNLYRKCNCNYSESIMK